MSETNQNVFAPVPTCAEKGIFQTERGHERKKSANCVALDSQHQNVRKIPM